MKHADLHLHTSYSHGLNSPWEMHVAAQNRGLGLIGFSEHSPRPRGYDYTREYRDELERHFPDYIRDVLDLKRQAARRGGCRVLLGLEMDWLENEREFMLQAIRAHAYDYLIGSVHFLGTWGFDDQAGDWAGADRETRFAWYERYFQIWRQMLGSGWFQIAAHPDLIKIFSLPDFKKWLKLPASLDLIAAALGELKASGMAMEISSAGLRKPCAEIYPGPEIMGLAADFGVQISLASDAHSMRDVGSGFDLLIRYAKSFGFRQQTVFYGKGREHLPL